MQDAVVAYHPVSRKLHWLVAFLILFMLALGWSFGFLPKNWHVPAIITHKNIGILILALAFFRLAWRWTHFVPPLPGPTLFFERWLAQGVHYALYALMFLMPLTGWAMGSAAGRPMLFLGMIPLPSLTAPDRELAHRLRSLHGLFAYALAGLIALHVLAALYHHFVRRDGLLRRIGA
jgi:cytochrome b561